MKRLFLVALFLFTLSVNAATLYSITNGNWSSGTTWSTTSGGTSCNCTPSTSDMIIIETDVTFDIASFSVSGNLTIDETNSIYGATGTIEIKNGGYLNVYGTLTIYNLTFFNGSYIYQSITGEIIVLNNLTNNNNSDNVSINGTIDVTGTFDNGNGGIITGNGSIVASTYTGAGSTFGHEPTNTLPDGQIITSGPLPLTLMYFTGNCENNECLLIWETYAEIGVENFEILTSEDGVTYNLLDVVPAMGYTLLIESYTYKDARPLHGTRYYKLFEKDFNGEYIELAITDVNCELTTIEMYPNPINEGDVVYLSGEFEEIQVIDLLGRNINALVFNKQIFGLSSGIYTILIDNKFSYKLIVK